MKVDKKALRKAAERADELGGVENHLRGRAARLKFDALATPVIVLALLDEVDDLEKRLAALEAKQQTIQLTGGE